MINPELADGILLLLMRPNYAPTGLQSIAAEFKITQVKAYSMVMVMKDVHPTWYVIEELFEPKQKFVRLDWRWEAAFKSFIEQGGYTNVVRRRIQKRAYIEQLQNSTLETNRSVQETNLATKENYRSQKAFSIAVVTISVLTAVISSFSFVKDNAKSPLNTQLEKRVQILETSLQRLTTQQTKMLNSKAYPSLYQTADTVPKRKVDADPLNHRQSFTK